MKSAFPLDLLNLPLSEKAYVTSLNDGYFGIFADMLPQGWNKNMLSRSDKKIDLVKHAFYSNLIIINDNNIIKGLLLEDQIPLYQEQVKQIQNEKFAKNFEIIVSPIGGVRPKVLVKIDDKVWIINFKSKHDKYDNPLVEYAMFKLAERCGITIPNVMVKNINGDNVLFSQRFGENQICLSGGTLLNVEKGTMDYSYHDIYKIIPDKELFKRIVFSVLTKNMDDHLWNHSFLYNGKDITLSPMYDMMPLADDDCLLKGTFDINLKEDESIKIINLINASPYFDSTIDDILEIKSVVMEWEKHFKNYGISSKDIDFLRTAFSIAFEDI